jgi:hypothetical protein
MSRTRRRFMQTIGATGVAAVFTRADAQLSPEGKYPVAELRMDERNCSIWARTALHVWPEKYVLVSLPTSSLPQAASIVALSAGTFAALVLERDEVSLTLPEHVWSAHAVKATAQDGPYRAVTFDLSLDLEVFGYFAPAAVRLANERISIVPQSAYLKDHVLVHEKDLEKTVAILQKLIEECKTAQTIKPH